MSKKVVFIVSLILIAGTLCTVGIMYRTDPNEATRTAYSYREVTQDFARTSVSTSIEEAEADEGSNDSVSGFIPGIGYVGSPEGEDDSGSSQVPPTDNEKELSLSTFFMQNEEPQASWTIGNTGKTVKDKGCAITCLANMASFEGVTDVATKYKDATADASNFTSAGAVYWDKYLEALGSNYRLSQKGVAFNAEEVAKRVDSGSPTLLFYDRSFDYYLGSQHYVFVTGYKRDSSGDIVFTVADPTWGYKQVKGSVYSANGVVCNYFS